MKKAILCLILCAGLFLPSFAENITQDNDLSKVSNSPKIQEAVRLLETFPADGSYKRIMGNNPTKKPILVQFKNIRYVNPKYKDFDALGWKTGNRLYIFVNTKHKDAPVEALSALISNIAVHTDEDDSINEQIFAWSLEAVVWNYLTAQKPELKNSESALVKRENLIESLYLKSPEDALYIARAVRENTAYQKTKTESKGYSSDILGLKIERLYEVFEEIHEEE